MNNTATTVEIDGMFEAQKRADTAKSFITQIESIKKEILKTFPIRSFKLTKSQLKKAQEFPALIQHLEKITREPYYLRSNYEEQQRQEQQKLVKYQKQQRQLEQEKAKTVRLQQAVNWLIEHGHTLGQDFILDNAIDFADRIAFELAVEEKQKSKEYFDFDGHEDCSDSCQGWDGSSRRCECGNFRVDWEAGSSHTFDDPSIYQVTF
jgi:hypothetical protein